MPGEHPSLRAIPFQRAEPVPIELLSRTQRAQLMRHAVVHARAARSVIYSAGADAGSVFIIGEGVVKSFRDLPSGRRRIAAFLFARDIFGLAEAGRYVNTVQAITPVRLYEIELATLAGLFRDDSDLELQFLCKTVHVLREAQHHNIIVGRRDAVGRLAMFIAQLIRRSGYPRVPAVVNTGSTHASLQSAAMLASCLRPLVSARLGSALVVLPGSDERVFVGSRLMMAGLRVRTPRSFRRARSVLLACPPSVLVTDAGSRQGLALARLGRALRPDVTQLLSSDRHDPELRRDVEAVGAAFLPAPMTEERLLAAFYRMLLREPNPRDPRTRLPAPDCASVM